MLEELFPIAIALAPLAVMLVTWGVMALFDDGIDWTRRKRKPKSIITGYSTIRFVDPPAASLTDLAARPDPLTPELRAEIYQTMEWWDGEYKKLLRRVALSGSAPDSIRKEYMALQVAEDNLVLARVSREKSIHDVMCRCEYEEVRTYADRHAKRVKTYDCISCRSIRVAQYAKGGYLPTEQKEYIFA